MPTRYIGVSENLLDTGYVLYLHLTNGPVDFERRQEGGGMERA